MVFDKFPMCRLLFSVEISRWPSLCHKHLLNTTSTEQLKEDEEN